MSNPKAPKKRFGANLSQPVAPTPDELMFPAATINSVTTVTAIPEETPDPWVAFGSYVHRSTYMQIKQAEFWEPGFEIREFVEKALVTALSQLPGAQRELPSHVLEKLLKSNRKLNPK